MSTTLKIQPHKILIVRLSSLGDIVHGIPLCQQLKKHYPHACISWLTREKYKELLQMNVCLDTILTISDIGQNKRLKRIKEIWRIIYLIRRERFDVVIDLHCVLISAIIVLLSGAHIKLGIDKKNDIGLKMFTYYPLSKGNKLHRIHTYLSVLRILGIDDYEISFPLAIPTEIHRKIDHFLTSQNITYNDLVIAIHPGTSVEIKRWDEKNFAALASQLASEYKTKVIILFDAGEKHLAKTFKSMASSLNIICAPTFSLKELSALLHRCDIFIGNDSGPLHLASALGTSAVGLFGPSDASVSGPYGCGHKVVRASLPCRPCYNNFFITFTCKSGTAACMSNISVEDVLKSVHEMINERFNYTSICSKIR